MAKIRQFTEICFFVLQIEERKQHQARLLDQLNSITVPSSASSSTAVRAVSVASTKRFGCQNYDGRVPQACAMRTYSSCRMTQHCNPYLDHSPGDQEPFLCQKGLVLF
jgi:hypothetical protein